MNDNKVLQVTCRTQLAIELDNLNEIQGELKEMTIDRYKKFRRLVEKRGIWFALHVWKELIVQNGVSLVKWWIIDGHGRKRMFHKMREEGWSIPPIPCVEIEAADLKTAKEAVLAASSSYQRPTSQGLREFLGEEDPGLLDDFDLPDIDIPEFLQEFYGDPTEDDGVKLSDRYETPLEYFQRWDSAFHFDLDVCAEDKTAKCKKYFTVKDNALQIDWSEHGRSAWMNPPYSDPNPWCAKAVEQAAKGVLVCALLPVDTSTAWFHDHIYKKHGVEVEFVRGRIRFLLDGVQANSPDFANMVVIFHPKP